MSGRMGAAELAAALAERVDALAPELLPAGYREGPHWRCGGIDGSAGQSLALHLSGTKAGVWHDFATGDKGDALDLVAATRFGGDRRSAMRWARDWLGVPDRSSRARHAPSARRSERSDPAADGERLRRRALALFLEGRENLRETPVAAYLAGRGVRLEVLGRSPRALRFHPAVWCREVGRKLPAMLAAVTDGTGVHVATHRTWLAEGEGGAWHKATLRDPKKSLGAFAGGFIPLQRGRSGKPLAKAPHGEGVAIAEGIETALSVALACPELRVLAAVALANMKRIELPATVTRVVICADDDRGNPKAQALVQQAAERFAAQGRAVGIAKPPVGKDFNDTLKAETAA